ncbi:hypothetical protein [Nonomuraea dietziae]|uniref:hypothetical protein n=1 Tax=Nonomuraea dietziae TaxID=65515 RepID=UPI0033EE51C2
MPTVTSAMVDGSESLIGTRLANITVAGAAIIAADAERQHSQADLQRRVAERADQEQR